MKFDGTDGSPVIAPASSTIAAGTPGSPATRANDQPEAPSPGPHAAPSPDVLTASLAANSESPSPGGPTRTSQRTQNPHALPTADRPVVTQLRDPKRYLILGEHGRGGLGRVSRAHDVELGRDVAIKELISRGHLSEVRFLREALITSRLEHPGIVPVHEAGRWPNGTPFYAMKLVAGRPLRDVIAERRTVDERIGLLHHVIAVADAIAYAHGRNIIHRDLKPSNVIVGDFGETVVIDWGLAKDLTTAEEPAIGRGFLRANQDDGLTSAGTVLGTPAYMAPEQARGERVDHRADVFAIGAMLWELCSLERLPPAYTGQRSRILRRSGIDHDLATIVEKACAADPVDRYPDAGALAADLRAFKAGARIAARRYSFFALLAHWTRRHRALATSLASVTLGATLIAVLYVRNVTIERDRADAARSEAEHARATAAMERDRARLSEAAMWLEKDPTRARELLKAENLRDPQQVLLLAEAESRAATQVISLSSRIQSMQSAGHPVEIAIVTINGELIRLDVASGTARIVDSRLTGPLTNHKDQWCYSQMTGSTGNTVVSGCGNVAPLGKLLQRPSSKLAWIDGTLYALEAGDLYRLDSSRPVLVRRGILDFAGSDKLSMTCTVDGRLEVHRHGLHVLSSHCAQNESVRPMATKGEHYVALETPTKLVTDRGTISLPVPVRGEYAVALGDNGLIALGDLGGEAWMIRPGSLQSAPISQRASHPQSVAASESFVGFGYSDGTVVVIDTSSGHQWNFNGHQAAVTDIIIDTIGRHLITAADNEIRIWDLRPPAITVAASISCEPFHIIPTQQPNSFATDCSDGRALLWNITNNEIRTLHRHRDLAHGVTLYHENLCTGGWDGRVLCSSPHVGEVDELIAASERVRALVSCRDRLLVAIADGSIWSLKPKVQLLYKHTSMPSQFSVDSDCVRIGSAAYDGSLMIYNLANNLLEYQIPHAHNGQITGITFDTTGFFTTGADGQFKHWRSASHVDLIRKMSGPLKKLHVLSNGWLAVFNTRTLVMHTSSQSSDLTLTLARGISDVSISSDEHLVALVTLDEIVVIDRQRNAIATSVAPASNLGCVQFTSPHTLAVCDKAYILSLSLDSLSFLPINSVKEEKL